ncbi:MAG: AAA family ATPase [Candidatus Hydrogenedentes bacterium]|nr:AAA family ATPase [Candidatus Hydrogenedentota bacterium]
MSKDFSTVVDDFQQDSGVSKAPRGPSFNLKRLITMRLPIMILVGIGLAIPLSIAAWILSPVKYTAVAQLRYSYVQPRILDTSNSNSARSVNYDKYVATEINTIRGNTILQRVAEDAKVREIPEVAKAVDKLAFLRGCLSVVSQGKSEVVQVMCSLKGRNEALLILESTINQYMEYSSGQDSMANFQRVSALTKERDKLESLLNETAANVAELEADMGGNPDSGPRDTEEDKEYQKALITAQEELSRVESEIGDLSEKTAQLSALQEQVAQSPSQRVFDFNVETQLNSDSRVSGIRQSLVAAESRFAQIQQGQREGSPQVNAEGKKLKSLRGEVARVEQQVRQEVLSSVRTGLEERLQDAEGRKEEAETRMAKFQKLLDDYQAQYMARAQENAQKLAQLEKLRTKELETRDTLSELRRQITDLQLEENAPARVTVQATPMVPPNPDVKQRLLLAVAAVAVSLGIGVAIGVLIELLDRNIRTPQDLSLVTSHQVIACIPHASEDKKLNSKDELPLVTADFPNSLAADEFRRVMARMLYPVDNAGEVRSLLVASPTLGDGKTTFACNLAVALEQANRRVLLVDLSSQRPSVEPRFNLKPAAGLVELLNGEGAPEDFIRRTAFENLGIIGPGLSGIDLAGRLGSREMEDFLEWADDHFDHTIIDSPPMLLMADAKMLAPNVDFVALVVGVKKSSAGMITRCIRDIEQLGGRILGVALNGVRSMRGGYMKNNQQLYYAYMERGPQQAYPGAVSGFDDDVPEIRVLDEAPEVVDRPASEVVLLSFEDEEGTPRR